MKILIILISLLYFSAFSLGQNIDLVKKSPERPNYTYKWEAFKIIDNTFQNSNDYRFSISKNARFKRSDSLITILALDTTDIKVRITSRKDTNNTSTVYLKAIQNPYFHSEWDTLKPGEIPTPLTDHEFYTFKIYSQYLLLDKPVPEFILKDIYGNSISDSTLKGKVSLLNFWIWPCPPCVAEIPALNKLGEYYKGDKNVALLSFFRDSIYIEEDSTLLFESSMRGGNPIRKFAPVKIELGFQHLANTVEIGERFNVRSFPTNILVDKNGFIRDVVVGAKVDHENEDMFHDWVEKIEKLKLED